MCTSVILFQANTSSTTSPTAWRTVTVLSGCSRLTLQAVPGVSTSQTCVMERDDVMVLLMLEETESRDMTGPMLAMLRTTTYIE